MPGPPDDVPPAELFLALGESRHSEVVSFPRKTSDGKPVGTVRIQVLHSRDHITARKQALRFLTEKEKLTKEELETPMGHALLGDAAAHEVLAMACLTEKSHGGEEQGKPFYPRVFRDAEQLCNSLSADEVAVLFENYRLVQSKYGPFERDIQTEEDLSKWIKRLVEGAAEFPLRHLSSGQWAESACLLAQRAYTLSRILESLLPSLPDTLKSRLGTFSLGTGFFGAPAGSTSADGSDDTLLKIADVTITSEDAAAMAQRLKAAEESVLAALDEAERLRD
jgi:hypothetical protein